MTQAYRVGGHTRVVERWIAFDQDREHTVLLTDQGNLKVPPVLGDVSDGRLILLDGPTRVSRVVELAGHLSDFDLVLLHINPFDAVAVAACAGTPDRPRTLLYNHGDHHFWLGLSAADVVVSARSSGEAITSSRRVRDSARSCILPIPILDARPGGGAGDRLRRELSIDEAAPVSLTMADVWKFGPVGHQPLLSLIDRLLRDEPELHHLAMGVTEASRGWGAMLEAHPDRLHLLGRHDDTLPAQDAATLYLDSYPFSSITSALEAASRGLPVLSLYDANQGPFAMDDVGLVPVRAADADAWMATARRWVADGDAATRAGEIAREQCRGAHGEAAWRTQLEEVLARPFDRRADPGVQRKGAPSIVDRAAGAVLAARAGEPTRVPWSDFGQPWSEAPPPSLHRWIQRSRSRFSKFRRS